VERLAVLAVILVMVASACAAADGGDNQSDSTTAPTVQTSSTSTSDDTEALSSSTTTSSGDLGERSALSVFTGGTAGGEYPDTLPTPTVDTSELLRGQVPDGIPAIDNPQFVSVADADEYLTEQEAVVVLDIEGDARAYPVQVLIWHEIVNDVVGGVPVSITYCPLCNSAVSFRRVVQGEVTTFGTSGLLFNSALVMYDRLTESLWTHYNGEAIAGIATSERLGPISSPLLAWAEFKEAFPDGLVLDRHNTGHNRSYGSNPYTNYDNPSGVPFLFRGELDDQLGAQRRVAGVSLDGVAKAWTLEAISGGAARATHDVVGDQAVVVFWKSGQATALESGQIDGGRDVGSVGVFRPDAAGQALMFSAEGPVFVDDVTGSTWNVLGKAIDGPLRGTELEPVPHLDTFWFAWFSYNPGTALVEG
jgi:hypothetical protein